MISSSIELNNLDLKQIVIMQVNCIAQVPQHTIWLWRQRKQEYSPSNCPYKDDLSGSEAENRHVTVSFIMQELHQRLMSLLDNFHTSSLMYQPCW